MKNKLPNKIPKNQFKPKLPKEEEVVKEPLEKSFFLLRNGDRIKKLDLVKSPSVVKLTFLKVQRKLESLRRALMITTFN